MTNFEKAYKKVAEYEGGYVNDPDDRGGETYKGISRNNFPKWIGWEMIDGYKHQDNFPFNLSSDAELHDEVISFYKKYFWDAFKLDNVEDYNVAYEVYEQAINHGAGRAAYNIQKVTNALNYNNEFGEDLELDGLNGPATRARLALVANSGRQTQQALVNGLNSMQGYFYVSLGTKDGGSSYRKYMKGWLSKRNEGYPYEQ